jgi:Xaa-Pro dipeptidase
MVMPKFEEPSIRQSLGVPAEVRPWEEDENPYAIAAGLLADRKLASGKIGIEETTRTFIVDGLAAALPSATGRLGRGGLPWLPDDQDARRTGLMQVAADITVAALRHTHANVRAGMGPKRHRRPDGRLHRGAGRKGQLQPDPDRRGQRLSARLAPAPGAKRGPGRADGLRLQCRRLRVGHLANLRVRRGDQPPAQGLDRRRSGPAGGVRSRPGSASKPASVDRAVRAYYESLGWGPRYKLPGLSHRTGHGIGMDGHEPVNFVMSETTKLAPGMCFSDEPGIYIPGEFGVRLEDCIHLTPQGPALVQPAAAVARQADGLRRRAAGRRLQPRTRGSRRQTAPRRDPRPDADPGRRGRHRRREGPGPSRRRHCSRREAGDRAGHRPLHVPGAADGLRRARDALRGSP